MTSVVAKAAAAGVGKALASRTGTRLGSRNERRQVYQRFLEAEISAVAQFQHWRFVVQISGSTRSMGQDTAEKLGEISFNRTMEIKQAYMDLRMVTNEAPLEKADELLTNTLTLVALVNGDEEVFQVALNAVGEAERAFVDACRDDLWYLPQRWQLYRPAWWKVKVKERTRRRAQEA